MPIPKKPLSVQLPAQIIIILEILCRRTGRAREEFIEEGLEYIFQEYKEIIFDTVEKIGLEFNKTLSKVPKKEIRLDSYKSKKEVKIITELELTMINIARRIIIQDGSHYSKTLKNGAYLYDTQSKWQVFEVEKTELSTTRVVLWNERDDGSYSVHFSGVKPIFYCFEN